MKTRLTIIGIVRLLTFAFIATGCCLLFPAYSLYIGIFAGALYTITMGATIATEVNYQKHYKEMGPKAEEFRNSSIFAFYETPVAHYIEGKLALRKFRKEHPEVKTVDEALKMMNEAEELSKEEKAVLTDEVKLQETTKMVASNDDEEKEELTK